MKENKKISVGLITFEQYEGRKEIGSSRIRGRWLADNWDEAEIFVQGQKYDVVLYQKAYWCEHAEVFNGIKILDLCDPDFLHWGYRTKQMIDLCDAVTTSTEALAEAVRKFTDKPVVCISDRMDLGYHKIKKIHSGKAKNVVWFGYSDNFEMLKPVIHFLIKNNLNLIVVSNKDYKLQANQAGRLEVTNYRWTESTVNENIIKGDIVINPKSSKGKWKYKSNNKSLTAYALGMPVARNIEELVKFIDCDERIKEVEKRTQELKEKHDVRISIGEFENLIKDIKNKKDGLG